jgi:hypothetical protein
LGTLTKTSNKEGCVVIWSFNDQKNKFTGVSYNNNSQRKLILSLPDGREIAVLKTVSAEITIPVQQRPSITIKTHAITGQTRIMGLSGYGMSLN